MSNTFYITTPIYYVNDVPHIGHAYTTIAADVLARYWRLRGRDVFFLTGLDEHGQKVQQAAAKAGIDPQAHCDRLAPQFEQLWNRLNISNDAFIRTTEPRHKGVVQRYLQELFNKQLIYKDTYTGWYCTFDERFWTEKDVTDGLCPDCKRPLERLSESNYFFKMGQYQERLIEHIKTHKNFIRPPSRRNEVLGFLQTQKLGDLSISRPKSRLSWGIELPFDKDYVTYVWFDALVNYISALEYKTPQPSLDRYWPASVHLVGKDILTTHAVYWSTILMALNLPLPETIYAHGWWTVNGEKMSKSRGNVVDPNAIVDEFGEFGVDAFRYFLMREVPFGQDGDFSREALIGRVNSDLADGLGNLVSRTLTMIERFTQGRIPPPSDAAESDLDAQLTQSTGELMAFVMDHIEQLRFNRALETMWELIQRCDQYIDKTAPWTLAKKSEDKARLHAVLHRVVKALELLIPLLYPIMPQTAESMASQLGLSPQIYGRRMVLQGLVPGREIAKGKPLFPRIDHRKTQGDSHVTDSSSPTETLQPSSATTQITLEEFQKVHLKTAKVLSAERVPRSEKLIKLQVDLGGEQRQVVAGIGKKYTPEELIGRTVVLVANLKPAKLMGVESQGMVLAAGDADVLEVLILQRDVPPGTKVK